MKKIVASVGLVAVGVSGAFAAYAPGLSAMDTSKAWSVSGSLRGFYDDNYLCMGANEQDSFGFEVSPSVRFNLPLDQSYLGVRYIYAARYYDDRTKDFTVGGVKTDNDPWDQSHQFDFLFNHAFNERYTLDVRDSFVIAQEPEMLGAGVAGGPVITVPYRTEGDNLRNLGQVTLKAQMTRLLGLNVGYNNVYWNYDQEQGDDGTNPQTPSYSAQLDRIEQLGTLELGYQAWPETRLFAGYKLGLISYTSDEMIDPYAWNPFLAGTPALYEKADYRDNMQHYLYGGVTQNFARNISLNASAGASYIDYDDDDFFSDTWAPYANVSFSWNYLTGSSVQLGYLHSFNQTDRFDAGSQMSSTFFAAINHQITPKLMASVHGHFQNSEFDGGAYDGDADKLLMLGVNLAYAITPHWSAEVGYSFDDLNSDGAHNDYQRNRVYLGVSASY